MRLNELYYRLDEGRKEQFMAMMPKPFLEIKTIGNTTWKDKWSEEVNWALTTLKKQDRIVWYLRLAKGIMLHYLVTLTNNNQYTELKELAKKELKKIENIYGAETIAKTNLTTIESHLQHFLSLNIAGIDNIVWTNQTPKDLLDKMATIEKDWKEKQKSTIPHNQVERYPANIVIEFQNGWEWMNLHKNYCDVEGKAMGHCGNAASYGPHDTILSLREPVKGGWMPHLTFVLNTETGMLGEMKGRGNQKPAAKYHPYIIELLKKPFIKGIMGGGYAPENNFTMNDLTPAQQEELIKIKPRLATFSYRYKKFGVTQELVEDLDKKVMQYGFGFDPEYDKTLGKTGGFIIGAETAEWFAERNRSFEYYYKIVQMGYIEDIDVFSDTETKYFLENLPDNIYEKIKSYIEKTYFNEKLNDNLDLDDRRDVYSFLDDEGDELIGSFRRAVEQGYQVGTMDEIYKAVRDYLEDPLDDRQVKDVYTRVASDNAEDWVVNFWVMPGVLFGWVDTNELDNISDWDSLYVDYIKDFDRVVPQNGFWEYDNKSAIQYFIEENPQFSVAEEKK